MYEIANYDELYKPLNKSGGELKNPDYVKLPCKPKGDGLQALFEQKRGLEIFAIWCLLLEKTTLEKPENRGKLLNHKDEPASIEEIAKSISLKGKEPLVEFALITLISMKWVILRNSSEQSSAESEQSSEEGIASISISITKDKVKDKVQENGTYFRINKKLKTELPDCFNNEQFKECLKSFSKQREEIKAPLTERAVLLLINRLVELSDSNNKRAIAIMDQSIMNSWKGVFPLRGEYKSSFESNIEETIRKYGQKE